MNDYFDWYGIFGLKLRVPQSRSHRIKFNNDAEKAKRKQQRQARKRNRK